MYYVVKSLPNKKVQERVELSRLKVELNLIEKQKRSELKMHDSEAQKIRSKYSKTGVYSASFSEAAGVKMYETHNPGFCYKRNGAHKIPPSISSIPVLDFQQLRSLLFTNGEVDIDKLLCLHMLSVHTTEDLTMPNIKLLKDVATENTPIERLIQRSKKISKLKKEQQEILNVLPIYIIDIAQVQSSTTCNTISTEETEEQLFRDARITSRLLINSKIQEILVSVLATLKDSKSEKFKQLLDNAQEPLILKKIFSKLHMQEFLKMLRTYSLITSCESYVLTPKIKHQPVHLEIRTVFGHLESLILQIRKYILQVPSKSKNEWKSLYELDEEVLQNLTSSTSQNIAIFEAASRFVSRKKSSRSMISSARMRKSEVIDKSVSYLSGRSYRNFVTRNILPMQSITRKVFDVEDKPKKSSSSIVSKRIFPMMFSSMQLSSIASGHETEAKTIEVVKSQASRYEENEEQLVKNILPESASIIKRSSCCACQEKWKSTLPFPKIPNYKRPGLPAPIYEDSYKISSMKRIASMISQELYKLDSYDVRYSAENVYAKIKPPSNAASPAAPENEISTIAESVEISPYDLARVSHEIADKETNKKLNQFLKESHS